jgi:hypothetical protein
MKLKRQDDLIKEGKPYIVYFRGVSEKYIQVFLTEQACITRIAELKKQGYLVTRMQ